MTTRNKAADDLIAERPDDDVWRFLVSAALGIEREHTVEKIRAGLRQTGIIWTDGVDNVLDEAAA